MMVLGVDHQSLSSNNSHARRTAGSVLLLVSACIFFVVKDLTLLFRCIIVISTWVVRVQKDATAGMLRWALMIGHDENTK